MRMPFPVDPLLLLILITMLVPSCSGVSFQGGEVSVIVWEAGINDVERVVANSSVPVLDILLHSADIVVDTSFYVVNHRPESALL